MKMIPKRVEHFVYRGHEIIINAEYDNWTDFGINFKGDFLGEAVYLTYEVRNPDNGIFAVMDKRTIQQLDQVSLVVTHQKRRNKNKIKNRYDLIHLSESYQPKLDSLIKKIKYQIDYSIDGSDELRSNQEITNGIPGSLKGLVPK